MKKPAIPADEKRRVKALHDANIFDTTRVDWFDQTTHFAAELFEVAIALICLVDRKQEIFLSRHGLEINKMSRDESFSGHAILADKVFYVPNALEDERFVDNPQVTGAPSIRLYAGAPLVLRAGQVIGVLCIIDNKPRELTQIELKYLRTLGNIVQSEFEQQSVQYAAQSILSSEARLEAILDMMQEGVIGIDSEGYIKTFNPAAQGLFAYTQHEALGSKVDMLLPKVYSTGYKDHLKEYLKTSKSQITGVGRELANKKKLKGKRKDGSTFPIELSMQHISLGRRHDRFVTVVRDLSQAKAVMEKLTQSEAKTLSIIENAVDAIISIDRRGFIKSFNLAAETLFQYTREEIIGQKVNMLMPEPYATEHDGYLEHYLETGEKKVIGIGREVVGLRKDGSSFALHLSVSEFESSEGGLFTAFLRDITKEKEQQEILRESEAFLQASLDSMSANIAIFKESGEIIAINKAWKEFADLNLLGKPEYALGQNYLEQCDSAKGHASEGADVVAKGLRQLLKGEIDIFTHEYECHSPKKEGWYMLNATMFNMKGEKQVVIAHTDITLTRSALIAAEKANEAKSLFLAKMSHELRTPLNAILGFSEIFDFKEGLPAELKENAHEIRRAGKHLLTLINEILDLAQIESGQIELSKEYVLVADLLVPCRLLMEPLAKAGGIELDIVTPEKYSDLVIKTDYTRLKQVLLNLISNAIKYNVDNGYVHIGCVSDNVGLARIFVKDNGRGISENNLSRIFKPFNRVENLSNDTEGTGIGLTITKQLVEMMGGTIGVKSILGKGSSFWIEFPIVEADGVTTVRDNVAPSSEIKKLEKILSRAVILVAEDNPANQAVLKQQLELLGLHADFAANGIKAWELYRKKRYDVLITDINMPLMNGFELVEKIRKAEEQSDAQTIIIALTAYAMAEDAKLCLEKGMDAFVTKPIKLVDLRAVLEKWLPEAGAIAKRPDPPTNLTVTEDRFSLDGDLPVDISALEELVGNEKQVHRKLFRTFIKSAINCISNIETAYQNREIETIKNQAHQLKSSARSMGAHKLADACQTLEKAAIEHNQDDINSVVKGLEDIFLRVRSYIESLLGQEQPQGAVNVFYQKLKVLLVDDDPLMLDVGKMMLAKLDITDVLTANTGQDALTFIEVPADQIDVILCDLYMPVMDGLEFMRHLAKLNFSGGIILISGQDKKILYTAGKIAREHQLNILGVVEKPIKPAELVLLINKLKTASIEPEPEQVISGQMVVTAEELQRGIRNNELVLFCQPKIDIASRNVVGLETLVRWQHPVKGLIPPYLFISMAEESGLIEELTQSVFKMAMHATAILRSSGHKLTTAINISVDTLSDLTWPDYAIKQVNDAGIDPSSITLEITETRLMNNLASALEILVRLSMKGFKLSIDDFGTGYSSMEQLQRVPFSELKIDRAFVQKATQDKSALAIIESSILLAKKLDMSTVAEGVESQEHWDLVASLGCDQVQGYFIAKPMPFDECQSWLKRWEVKN